MKTEQTITKALMLFGAIFLLSIPVVSLAADNPKVGNESHVVKLADAKIEYFSEGQGDVVVLLPGGGLNVSYMEGLAQSLSKAGYRAVRINPQGAGASKGAADAVTLHDLAGDVAGVIEALDVGPVHVAGHAFGNRVARMLAAHRPELVSSVILLAAGGKVAATPEADAALEVVFSPTATDEEYLASMKYMVGDPEDTEIAGEALRRSRAPEAAAIQFRAAATADLDEWWAPAGEIRYLALQGSHDQAAPPENGVLLRKELGDRVTLVSLKGAGHLMLVTRPQETAREILTFLESLRARTHERPRLVLQITVDQFRGDLPTRYADRLGEGGLRYLLEEGIHYNNAHHAHANTETIVGHVTLATGAHPAAHGMIGNIWFDRKTGVTTYNIEDRDHHLLTEGADVDADTEIDPTQKAASSDGRSPRAILTTTFSDELASLTAGRAKIFGVSVKDRGAVSMAGHTGKAFWFSKATNQFVTSSYYYDEYPQWVVDWNARKLPESYANTAWELLHPIDTYLFGDRDDQEWEAALGSYGRTFPHEFTTPENPYFSTFLTISPAGDEMTTDFAKTVIAEEGLGDDDITDYLGVSYSANDYVGHFFGPSSLEAEDNILRLDRTLADLFAYVDQEIGLEHTLIVLSADHGGPEAPGYLNKLGIPAGYVSPDEWDKDPVIAQLKNKFGIRGQMIEGYDHPYLYLSNDIINDTDIDLAALETSIANELVAFRGVSYAIPSTSLERGTVPDNGLTRAVLNNYNAARSGNIYVVFNPGWFINDLDGLSVAVVHGSPWRYDTYVPILFAGSGIEPQTVSRRVHTVDVAITLATAIGTRPPSGAAGEVLLEVLGQ